MAKLHELLAVMNSLRGQANSTSADLKNTFEKKRGHFSEALVTFKSSQEGVEDKVEARQSLQTTVKRELEWISIKIASAINAANQVDEANTVARADIVLEDGTVLLAQVPATGLLQLEHRMEEVQALVSAIPTLDPARGFEQDPDKGEGIWKARDIDKVRTEKVFDFVVMVPATDKHPAQVKELNRDKPVGTIHQQEWSSLITVAEKGDMLDRVEKLARAVKAARSRANEAVVDVTKNKIGSTLLDYVFKG